MPDTTMNVGSGDSGKTKESCEDSYYQYLHWRFQWRGDFRNCIWFRNRKFIADLENVLNTEIEKKEVS
jgi:hypothetical protein